MSWGIEAYGKFWKYLIWNVWPPQNPTTFISVIDCCTIAMYRQVSNTSRTLVGNKIVDHSDVVGALPVGVAPTTSSFST